MTFVQIIDYETRDADKMDMLLTEWMQATEGQRTVSAATLAHDRDNPMHYVEIVEFPSYEVAMRNNDMPQTQDFAERMRALCSSGPTFLNLDVEAAR